jgi:hypothetical protein
MGVLCSHKGEPLISGSTASASKMQALPAYRPALLSTGFFCAMLCRAVCQARAFAFKQLVEKRPLQAAAVAAAVLLLLPDMFCPG